MSFTERLSSETQESHSRVDQHPFARSIALNREAGRLYVNFNKVCIDAVQQVLSRHYKQDIFKKLYRNTREYEVETTEENKDLLVLVERCKKFPLEHAYMFYLGLLFGGSMLKRMLKDEDQAFFEYANRKELITEFKHFLDEYITDIQRQKQFIEQVNVSYSKIHDIFSAYLKQTTN